MRREREREAVRIRRDLHGRVVQELAEGIVGQETALGSRRTPSGVLVRSTTRGPRWRGLNSSKTCSIAPRS